MIEERRETRETNVSLRLTLDGGQNLAIETGFDFFDHMLEQLAFRAGWDLTLQAEQSKPVDDHHLIEDVALVLGTALRRGTLDRGPIRRFASLMLPMDDALVLCAIDLGGRPYCAVDLDVRRETIGPVAVENIRHFFHSLAMTGQFNLHLRSLAGSNAHHIIEASFKALGLALREALTPAALRASTKEAT